jgi:putative DNA methylase
MSHVRKKLIEVALPLEAINKASAREKSIRHGHPSNLHRWWARRPLAAARAVIFAQMVDDPSAHPEWFPSEEAQEKERQRLFRLIEELVQWENTTNEAVLLRARDEIRKSWRATCEENKSHSRAIELFNPERLPAFHDPFAGGGSLPLEAQRLGLESYASDLNPVSVLICKAMIEIPSKFAGRSPVNPQACAEKSLDPRHWCGAQGLAEDVHHYSQWMRDEAVKRIGHLYPKIEITTEMAEDRPDLKPLVGRKLTVIAWLWARTVKSPNPAFSHVDVPLASSFVLSAKAGKEAYVEPVVDGGAYRFRVRTGKPKDAEAVKRGTSAGKWNAFRCIMSDVPITYEYIRGEGIAGRMGSRLMAVVAEGVRGRIYLSPPLAIEAAAHDVRPSWRPELEINYHPRDIKTQIYGLTRYGDLFTPRQLVTLNTFSDLLGEARELAKRDALAAGYLDDGHGLDADGAGATAYADAVAVYLALALSKATDSNNSLCPWEPVAQCSRQLFGRQAIPMVWDFAEANPLHDSSGGFSTNINGVLRSFACFAHGGIHGHALQADASQQATSTDKVISGDPPYYDNIGYADLSDFFTSGYAAHSRLSSRTSSQRSPCPRPKSW